VLPSSLPCGAVGRLCADRDVAGQALGEDAAMAFVKLDCAILHSSIWPDKEARDIFITALLMAEPFELTEPTKQINVLNLDETGWTIPPGWYGFVKAAGVGIVHTTGVPREAGLQALVRLCSPESESRSPEFEGRRMARIPGGYVILNFFAYRDRDHTAAERMRRLRERNKLRNSGVTDVTKTEKLRNVTQADAECRVQSADSKESPDPLSDGIACPDGLDTPEFRAAWREFETHRREKKCSLTATAARRQLNRLSKMGVKRALAAIDYSISNGWAGIFEPKSNGKHTSGDSAEDFANRVLERSRANGTE
jgi:hypothetical protein